MRKGLVLLAAVGMLAGCQWIAPASKPAATAGAAQAAMVEAVKPAIVRVEYRLQYDKGEPPGSSGFRARDVMGFRYRDYGDAAGLIEQERPLEEVGFLVSPTRVVTRDLLMNPRFVKSISVRFGDQLVEAKPAAWTRSQNAVMLDLAQPLKDARPLTFDASAKSPYHVINYVLENGAWTVTANPMSLTFSMTDASRKFWTTHEYGLVVDAKGTPVAVVMIDELPTDNSWKGSPASWPAIAASDMTKMLADIEKSADATVVRVTLNFRSPKKEAGEYMPRRGMGDEGEGGATEVNVPGVLVDKDRVLVPVQLKPDVTARLEGVTVHPGVGDAVPAKFSYTLADYGAFVASLEKPVEGAAPFSRKNILDSRDTLLMSAEVSIQGEHRTAYYWHTRIPAVEVGWKGHLYPQVSGQSHNAFIFSPEGTLVALPIRRRIKVEADDRYGDEGGPLCAANYLAEVFGDLPKYADLSNVPLSEEQEARIAWMGVELQALNRELARQNNVSEYTHDGQTGAIVAYVYPDSPAAKAGVKPGYVLLRLQVKGEPKPIELRVAGYDTSFPFPWDKLDGLPEQYYDRIPHPWPAADSQLNRMLTDIGFGKEYTAEFFGDGQIVKKDFSVVQSPTHFESAPRHKSPDLGLTVRDLTYEVRRYFLKKPDDPGVIVAKIEQGSKASVSGLKPFEIITAVNDKPVTSVKDFEELVKGQKELRLSVLRMTRSRIVKIDMTAVTKPAAPAKAPADEGEEE